MRYIYGTSSSHLHKCTLISIIFIKSAFAINAQTFTQIESSVNLFGEANGLYGNGVSFYDWNKDGFDDIVLTNDSIQPLFYLNIGGSFEQVQFPGIVTNNQVKSICWVDINNDQAPDIAFNISYGGFQIFLNNGNFEFTDISSACGIDQTESHGYGQSWGDYNHDGFLDVYISNYQTDQDLPFRSNYLYRNNGNNTFTDVTENAGLSIQAEMTFLSAWIDINLDTYPDLYVINDRADFQNYLYLNNGDGTFTDISTSSGLEEYFNPMSATVGDYDHDGNLDIYVTDDFNNRLYRNNGDNTFTDVAGIQSVQMQKACWGAAWIDVDRNGWEDLIVATANPFFTYNDLWFFNNNQGNFEVNQGIGFTNSFASSFAIATGDVDNNGTVDLLCHSLRPPGVKLYSNSHISNNYLKLKLEGTISNADGIGTLVKVYCNNDVQTKYMMCGDQYLSQNSQWLHFGLRDQFTIDSIILKWPSGIIDRYYEIEGNQSVNYIEGAGLICNISIKNKSIFCIGDTAILDAGVWDSYLWIDGSTDRYFAVTQSNFYSVEVTSNGTTILSEPFEIVFQEPEIAVIEFENTPCFGALLGSVSSVSHATAPVESIFFNNQELSLPIENLGEGAYQYSLTGSNGCVIDGNIVITQPTEISVELFFNIAEFPEDCESSISGFSNVSGGTPPYTIEWRFFLENEIIPFQIINQDSFNCVDFSEATLVQFRLLDSNGCPLVVEEMLIPSSNKEINSNDQFTLNPNPFENTFEITLKESALLSIFDISGKCIYTQDVAAGSTLIQPQYIAPGIYLLNINNQNINLNTRIVRR